MPRDDYERWKERTDERIAALTSGETVQNDRIDELLSELRAIREILEGKASDRDDSGLTGDVDEIQKKLRRIDGTLWPDALGNSGLVAKVQKLINRDERYERRAERWWKGLTPILVAIVSSAALLITNLDKIAPTVREFFSRSTSTEIAEKFKKPAKKVKRRRAVQTDETLIKEEPEKQDP